jgi:flagellar assembly protein FliH
LANNTLSKVIPQGARPGVSAAATSAAGAAAAAAAAGQVRQFEPRHVPMGRPASAATQKSNGPTPLLVDYDAAQDDPDALDIEAIRREAFGQGRQEGERAGEQRATACYREAVAAFGRSALQVATLKPRLRAEAERELVGLAFAIARRILRREIAVDPAAVTGLVRGCLDQFSRAEIHRLQLHPDDIDTVAEFFRANPAPQLEFVADPKVSRGGAVFETTRGTLDARVETQLDEIEKGLADQ